MNWMLNNSFMVADSGKEGPVYVAPHAGNAFYKPDDNQDTGTHYIAHRMASGGGMAVISSLSRERKMGIDFYRLMPDKQTAIGKYCLFGEEDIKGSFKFRKRYAWVAANEREHEHKKGIYVKFWETVNGKDSPVVFIHRQFLNPIRHPSLIDVVAFNCRNNTSEVIRRVNHKHKPLFEKILPVYRSAISFKNYCVLFKKEANSEFGISMFDHMEPKLRRRMERFDEKMQKHPNLRITHKRNFSGDILKSLMGSGTIRPDRPVIQLEISELLTRFFPGIAVHLSRDIVDGLIGKG